MYRMKRKITSPEKILNRKGEERIQVRKRKLSLKREEKIQVREKTKFQTSANITNSKKKFQVQTLCSKK